MAYSSQLGKLLIVDDDHNIADLLSINLGSEGYGITLENKASKAAEYDLRDYRLVLADCMNQVFTGFDLLDHIKSMPSLGHVGVIICSSSDRENDIIRALDSGADDYIVKPFSLRELVARIRSGLRRHPIREDSERDQGALLKFDDICVDLRSGKVTSDGMLITLSKTECAILTLLMKNVDNFVPRIEILRTVWGDNESANERIVDTNISRLRKKLGKTGQKIVNRSGLGYMLTNKAS